MSRARRRRLAQRWHAYVRRNDALVVGQHLTSRICHPMRIPPAYFRHAEGLSRRFVHEMRKSGL